MTKRQSKAGLTAESYTPDLNQLSITNHSSPGKLTNERIANSKTQEETLEEKTMHTPASVTNISIENHNHLPETIHSINSRSRSQSMTNSDTQEKEPPQFKEGRTMRRRASVTNSSLPVEHHTYSNGTYNNWRSHQLYQLVNDLVDDVSKIYIQDRLCLRDLNLFPDASPHAVYTSDHREESIPEKEEKWSETSTDLTRTQTMINTTVRNFITSLPSRYVLSVESPGEVLVHMRLVASVRNDPLHAFIHVGFHYQEVPSCRGQSNVKTLVVSCANTSGLMEYLMNLLVAGGNEIFDTNFLLTSGDKIVLIRCVIRLKGVTRFDEMEEQISAFVHAANGISFMPSTVQESPIPCKIGPLDILQANHQLFSRSHALVEGTGGGMKENEMIVNKIFPPKPLTELFGIEALHCQMNNKSSDVSHHSGFELFNRMRVNGLIMKTGDHVSVYTGSLDKETNRPTYALKVITKLDNSDQTRINDVLNEAKVATRLSHTNICRCFDFIETPTFVCVAFEYCSKGSLSMILSNPNIEYDYLMLAQDIANGMAYLHSKNVVHRDLKPDNIFIDNNNNAKIADFGLSVTHTGKEELSGETGTYRWMAPEVIRHEPYSLNSDVYSFGLVLWQLVTRELPFKDMKPIQAAYAIANGKRPSIPCYVPEYIARIISCCLEQDQLRRPSFANISMALGHFSNASILNQKWHC